MIVFTLRTRVYEVAVSRGEGAARWVVDAGHLFRQVATVYQNACGGDGFLVRFDLQYTNLLSPTDENFELDELMDVLSEMIRVRDIAARQSDDPYTLEFTWGDFTRLHSLLGKSRVKCTAGSFGSSAARVLSAAPASHARPQIHRATHGKVERYEFLRVRGLWGGVGGRLGARVGRD